MKKLTTYKFLNAGSDFEGFYKYELMNEKTGKIVKVSTKRFCELRRSKRISNLKE